MLQADRRDPTRREARTVIVGCLVWWVTFGVAVAALVSPSGLRIVAASVAAAVGFVALGRALWVLVALGVLGSASHERMKGWFGMCVRASEWRPVLVWGASGVLVFVDFVAFTWLLWSNL